jgi:predicted Fe-Mo cluster-binding NifX family protein
MNKKTIRFAFAVNDAGLFEAKHFGNAEKYLIYEWDGNEFIFIQEEPNGFRTFDESMMNGLSSMGIACVNLLEKADVQILVSRRFGDNISMVKSLFIPVIVNSETPEEVVSILKKHMRWIEDEIANHKDEYKLFSIKKGIMKTEIKKSGED